MSRPKAKKTELEIFIKLTINCITVIITLDKLMNKSMDVK
jgi:hypothetical protein